jgi:hypothetical protein
VCVVVGDLYFDLSETEALELAAQLIDRVEKARQNRRRRASARSQASEDP